MELGEQVKALRKDKKITIKKMAELTGLSTGFISQFERGITTIDVDHLNVMATILETDVTNFFKQKATEETNPEDELIVRSYQRPYLQNLNQSLHFNLSQLAGKSAMRPEYIEILPREVKAVPKIYTHEGEEFVFVLEGILTFYWDDQITKLYPGDAAHYSSEKNHNWANLSDAVVKLLVIYTAENK